jgi:hypothetical protein
MSEFSQGPGWWLASDGRWYPPEQHPDYVVPLPVEPVEPHRVEPPLVPPVPLPPGTADTPEPEPPAPGVPAPVVVAGPTPIGHPEVPSPYGVGPWAGPWAGPGALPVTSGLAIAALVMAILWIGGVGSLAAVILGIVALSQIQSSTGTTRGRGLATAAVVIGVVGVAGTVALVASGVVSTSQSALSPTASPPGGVKAPGLTPASSGVIRDLTGVPRSVAAAVGVPPQSLVTPPTIRMDQPKLVVDGKPGAVFIGGVFCPYCAAERWAIIMAFSRFGTFSNLEETTSSPWDVYPATATFSFHGVTYSSRYVGLAMAEHSGNDVDGPDTSSLEDPLTRQEADLWQRQLRLSLPRHREQDPGAGSEFRPERSGRFGSAGHRVEVDGPGDPEHAGHRGNGELSDGRHLHHHGNEAGLGVPRPRRGESRAGHGIGPRGIEPRGTPHGPPRRYSNVDR